MEFNLADLGNIEVDLRGVIETVSKYDIDDANKGGFYWLTKPNNGENPNILGSQIIKITMPFEMFQYCQDLEKQGHFSFPGVYDIRASVISGSGNKGGYRAVSIKQIARLKVSAEAYNYPPVAPPPASSEVAPAPASSEVAPAPASSEVAPAPVSAAVTPQPVSNPAKSK